MLPKKRGIEPFKVGVERLKKYDKMLTEFPKNLEIPVEPTYLRLLVRRRRQNQNKRKKELQNAANAGASTPSSKATSGTAVVVPTVKKEPKKPKVLTLPIPQAGDVFPTITYNASDFVAAGGDFVIC